MDTISDMEIIVDEHHGSDDVHDHVVVNDAWHISLTIDIYLIHHYLYLLLDILNIKNS